MNKRIVMGMLSVGILGGLLGWVVAPRPRTIIAGVGNADVLEFRSVRLRLNGCTTGGIDVDPKTLNMRTNQRVVWIVPGRSSEDYRWTIEPTQTNDAYKTPPADDYFYPGQGNEIKIAGVQGQVANNAYFTDAPAIPQGVNCTNTNPCEWDYDVIVTKLNSSNGKYDPCATLDPKIRIRD